MRDVPHQRHVHAAGSSLLNGTTIAALLAAPPPSQPVPLVLTVWIRSVRAQKSVAFAEVTDGSATAGLQVVWDPRAVAVTSADGATPADARKLTTGAAVRLHGTLVKSPKPAQPVELHATCIEIVGTAEGETYPLQKKAHSPEFLRDMVHLRARTAATAAMLRMRHTLASGIHESLSRRGCIQVHTPLLTSNDCEGGGELFSVLPADGQLKATLPASTAALQQPQEQQQPASALSSSFFGKPVFLTVSGQLHLETFACALQKVYTFGPTFRAENSNTPRHLAEFWMVEAELAPGSLDDAVSAAGPP